MMGLSPETLDSFGADSGASCSDAGPPTTGLDGGSSCGATLAASTFQYAICSCGSLQSTGVLTTDGYDSTKGGPTGALGANVGFNASAAWSAAPSLGGNLFSPGGISAPKGGLLRGDLHLGGAVQGGGQTFTVDGNAFVAATLPSTVHVVGTTTHVSSVAAPCNCSNPLPTTSLVAAHRAPNNQDSAIGLSPSAAGGGNPTQIDLPCGAFYLTVISPSKALTIAAHGHTELYIDGAVSASSALTFSIDPGASLDLFVAGGFSATSTLHLGSTSSPSSCRAYVAGSQFVVPASASIACNIYAPSASIALPSTVAYGAIYANGVTASSSATLHYDTSIQGGSCGPTCTMASCDDGNPCTVDACNSNGTCSHTNVTNGISCPTGANLCEQSYTCQAGACVGSNPVVCTAQDQCHGVGSCNQSTGVCSNPSLPNGTSCNDGNACTQTDSCQAGVCTGSNPIACMAGDSCHSAGACNASTGVCSSPTLNSGFCYIGGGCVASGATNGANTCETCQPTASTTQYSTVSNGTSCNDGNACTTGDACQGGTCIGNPVVCTALDQCHAAGMCVQGSGLCTNPSAPDGTTCTGTNLCDQTYACTGGACIGSNPVVCTASGQCQVAGSCNPSTGACSGSSSAPNGTPCNDGNACTTNDSCTGGVCSGTAVTGCGVPHWPAGSVLSVAPIGPTSAKLTWTAATDAVGVTGYEIYEDGELLTTVSGSTLTYSATGLATGAMYAFQIQASDATGGPTNDGPSATLTAQTPDPVSLNPQVDQSTVTTVANTVSFLYTGPDPIQSGLTAQIDSKRAMVFRGRVLDASGNPLLGAMVSVSNHPEYGFTTTRVDGRYDLVANGGGTLTLSFASSGLMSAERNVQAPWNDYVQVSDVALIARDPHRTLVDLSGTGPVQVARGSQVQDSDGTRQATLMVAAGTTAQMQMPDGTTQNLTRGHIRATEFTVGPNGPAAMPAELPATTGYTYAAAFTVDEADAAGASRVTFSQPVAVYLENFVGLNVGVHVPAGYYDSVRHVWVPSNNGRVVQILDIADGLATLDVDGSGQPASSALLNALGVSTDELIQLAGLYQPNQTLWRVPVPHFSQYDFNLGVGPPIGATTPSSKPIPGGGGQTDCPNNVPGCIVDVEEQVLGERVPVAGTPFTLDYRTQRTAGYLSDSSVVIPLTPSQPPPGLLWVDLEISIAGVDIQKTFGPAPNQQYTFLWDGISGYGAVTQGPQPVTVRITYNYPAVYIAPSENPLLTNKNYDADFGHYTYYGQPASINNARTVISLPYEWHGQLGHWNNSGLGKVPIGQDALGGWTLSAHHVLDVPSGILYYGDGHKRTAETFYGTISIVPAPPINQPGPVAIGPDGSIYVINIGFPRDPSTSNGVALGVDPNGFTEQLGTFRVWKIAPDGSGNGIPVVGKTAPPGPSTGDGGPATQATFGWLVAIAFDAQGSMYLADKMNNNVRRVDPSGIITTFAGNGTPGTNVDGVVATTAGLQAPTSLAAAPDGNVYVVDNYTDPATGVTTSRLLRVSTDGNMQVVTTYQLGKPAAPSGIPLSQAYMTIADDSGDLYTKPASPQIVAAKDGTIYAIVDNVPGGIRKIGPDGVLSNVVGDGNNPSFESFNGSPDNCRNTPEGVPALSVGAQPRKLAVGPNGDLVYLDDFFDRIRVVSQEGLLTSIAGRCQGATEATPNGLIATQAGVFFDDLGGAGLAVGPDDSVVLSTGILTGLIDQGIQNYGDRPGILQIKPPFAETLGEINVADSDGKTIFVFDSTGHQLKTVDAFTQTVLDSFFYDTAGRLTAIKDVNGITTTIQRDGTGNPIAIVVDPFGQTTTLSLDPNGNLSSIMDPVGNAFAYTYSADGLLRSTRTPTGGTYNYSYDGSGRLTQDVDPAGGGNTLFNTPTLAPAGNVVTQTTGMGVQSTYQYENLPGGGLKQVLTDPAGLVKTVLRSPNGVITETDPDGTFTTTTLAADPRFSSQAAGDGAVTIALPSGLTFSSTTTKSVALASPNDPYTLASATTIYSANGHPWTRTFNATSRTWTTTSPMGRTRSTTSDSAGRPVSASVPNVAPFSFIYDAHGRLQQASQGARVWTTQYDAGGDLSGETDPLLNTVSSINDANGRPLTTTLQDLREVGTTWDGDGNALSITLPGGLATQPDPTRAHNFSYTPVDLTQTYTPPSIGVGFPSTSYTYDVDRFLKTITRPDGAVVTRFPDTFERLRLVQYPQGTVTYNYSAPGGQLGSTTSSGGETTTFTYDGFLPKSITWSGPIAGSVTFGYNTDFRVTAETVNSLGALPFGYDADGLLTCAGAGTCPATGAIAVARDPQNGRLTGTTLGGVTDSYGYDAFNELASYAATYGGSSLFVETIVSRDANGRITEKTDALSGTTHDWKNVYDRTGRLTDVTEDGAAVSHYGYDGDDNRTSVGVSSVTQPTYDAQDRLVAYPSLNATYAFTANGELASKTVGPQITTYTYDALGNLLHVGLPAALPDGTQTIDYIVDGQNRRVGRKVNGTLAQGWLYQDQLRPVAQLDGSNNLVARFVYGSKANVPDYMVTLGGTYRILSDHLGSPRAVVDVSSGNLLEMINFDEFGNETDTVAGTLPSGYVRIPFGFAGGLYDLDTGLVRFGARDYDAIVGRWTSKDPVLFAGGSLSVYAYAYADPVDYVDLTGRSPWAIVERVVGAGVRILEGDISRADALQALIDAFENGTPGGAHVATDSPEAARELAEEYSATCGGSGKATEVESHVVDRSTGARGEPHVHGMENAKDRLPGHIFITPQLFQDIGDLLLPGPVFVGPFPTLPGGESGGGA